MSDRGTKLGAAAREFVGAPFKLHGRDPQTGLDCIGLVLVSLERSGISTKNPAGYALKNRTIGKWLAYADEAGLALVGDAIAPGDVLLVSPGPHQHHILIAQSQASAIHAHAGLRRVVEEPLARELKPLAQWRLTD
ncbi:MAG: NlpC/P60 family protein [Pseudomonadota bacterium]